MTGHSRLSLLITVVVPRRVHAAAARPCQRHRLDSSRS